MTLGVIVLLPLVGYIAVKGKGLSIADLPPEYMSPTTIGYDTILSYFLLFFFGLMLGQDIWQRVLTARDVRIGVNGTVLAGLYGIIYALAATFAGMLAYLYFQGGLESPRHAMPMFAIEVLPAGLAGLIIAAMFSAFMSTADGALIATTTLIAYDLIAPLRRLTEKGLTMLIAFLNLIVGVLGLGVAIFIEELLIALDIAYLVLSTTLFIPTIAGLYWTKPSMRAAIIAIAGSLIIAVGYALYIGWPEGFADIRPIVAGFIVNAILFLVATILWPRTTS